MELVPLRARASCALCHSKLPPRTEVYWDDATNTATCPSCMALLQHSEAAVSETVEADIDAPPAWGNLLADPADEGSEPDSPSDPEPEPEPEPEDETLPPAAESPFRSPPRTVSHGLTIRRAPRGTGSSDDPSFGDTELDRGDMGEGRVGQTIEAARIHGLEVLHGFDVASGVRPVDHLVIAVNGIWVIRAQDALAGRLERRDLGDWFSADPRLFVKDEDATHLIDETRRQVEALRARLGPTSFGDVVVRGVVCYGTAPAGWVSVPFDIANIRVTWRNLLVEPMLDPVMIDEESRSRLVAMLAADRRRAKTA